MIDILCYPLIHELTIQFMKTSFFKTPVDGEKLGEETTEDLSILGFSDLGNQLFFVKGFGFLEWKKNKP